ncbi:MAG TPA: VWA domain-containing protein [Vicinamibacterales bacterium]|nr:VWA domain-containing protein [Vicinamibacterales bacterium]
MRSWLPLLALLTAATLAPAAQVKFTARVESVRLDALVTRGGQPVLGLTADDFEVRDNGAVQKVSLLGAGSLPLDVILALDVSSSLTPERFAILRGGTDALLTALENDDRAALATFSHDVVGRQALTSAFDLIRRTLEDAAPSGATSLIDAIYAAIAMAEPGDRRSLLIVFSDGIDTTSWLRPDAVLRAAQRSEVVIYAVSTAGAKQMPQVLKEFTEASGGNVLEVESAGLSSAFVQILNEFRRRYLLSYSLQRSPSPGWHRLDVRVRQRGATVKARPGYHVAAR